MSGKARVTPGSSPPWGMLLLSGLLGMGLMGAGQGLGWPAASQGKAVLTQILQPTQPGWQIQLDAGALGLSSFARTRQILSELCGETLSPAQMRQVQQGLVNLSRLDGQEHVRVVPQAPPPSLPARDPYFGGTPAAVFEWSKSSVVMRGNLYHRPHAGGVLSGRLTGVLPFAGLQPTGQGFSLPNADFLPADLERAVVIDASLLRLHMDYKERLLKEWARWEFLPLSSLGRAVGPTIAYARWRGEGLFSIGITDRPAVEDLIARRFPDSVIPTAVKRVAGSRVRGFDPGGPAWVVRGDSLLASKSGGTERMVEALDSILAGNTSFVDPSPLMSEIGRLASLEPGWHIMVINAEPGSQLHWAALLRWNSPARDQVSGYLVARPGSW